MPGDVVRASHIKHGRLQRCGGEVGQAGAGLGLRSGVGDGGQPGGSLGEQGIGCGIVLFGQHGGKVAGSGGLGLNGRGVGFCAACRMVVPMSASVAPLPSALTQKATPSVSPLRPNRFL
jgi:hypothetical protein